MKFDVDAATAAPFTPQLPPPQLPAELPPQHKIPEVGELISKSSKPIAEMMLALFPTDYTEEAKKDPRTRLQFTDRCGIALKYMVQAVEPLRSIVKDQEKRFSVMNQLKEQASELIEAYKIQVAELQAELRQARELKGAHESKKVAELESIITDLRRALEKQTELNLSGCRTTEQLNAEVETRKAQAAGYERDIAHLTTAAAGANQERERIYQAVREQLGAALELAAERYGGKSGPFLEIVFGHVGAALAQIPK